MSEGDGEEGAAGWRLATIMLVIDPASGTDINPAIAATALGHTRTESLVAVLLARGTSVGEIAAAAGRKDRRICSHVKHMFVKHGLSRQTDLVRVMPSLASTVDPRR